jgi:hypothetical protein
MFLQYIGMPTKLHGNKTQNINIKDIFELLETHDWIVKLVIWEI